MSSLRRLHLWSLKDIVALKHLCLGLWYFVRAMSYGKKRTPAQGPAAAEFPLWEAQERMLAAGLRNFAEFEKI